MDGIGDESAPKSSANLRSGGQWRLGLREKPTDAVTYTVPWDLLGCKNMMGLVLLTFMYISFTIEMNKHAGK